MDIDRLIDHYVETNSEEDVLLLLKVLADPEQGGLGYSVRFFNPRIDIDGWEIDWATRSILLDTSGVFSTYSLQDLSTALKEAIETEILQTRASLFSRIAWGTGKVLLGVIETATGLVGILVPEPGTTAAGVVVFALGANTVADGFSQLAGANKGHGYNLLSAGSGALGASVADLAGADPELGRSVGKGVFLASSIIVGSVGSIKILRIPKQTFFRLGVGGRSGGVQIGRLDLMYGSERARDGMTILSINNNANQAILRFVTHNGRLVVNGRIVGQQRILRHEGSAKEILKGILKLLAHGARY